MMESEEVRFGLFAAQVHAGAACDVLKVGYSGAWLAVFSWPRAGCRCAAAAASVFSRARFAQE